MIVSTEGMYRDGDEVLICDGDIAVDRLIAISSDSPTRKPRIAGLHKGAIVVGEDFDAELPDEFWTQTLRILA